MVVLGIGGTTNWCRAAVEVGNIYFTGSRTTVGITGVGGGLTWNPAAGDWSGGGFTISWVITPQGSDFQYEYTITTPVPEPPENPGDPVDAKAQLSHWILELSKRDSVGNPLQDYWDGVFPDDEVKDYMSGDKSNPGLSADVYGVKIEPGLANGIFESTYTFTSSQVPVWGDFYAIDGGGTEASAIWARNTGFGTDPDPNTETTFANWIPRPDGASSGQVPEPMSLLVWLLLFAPLGLFGLRRRF
jgi:hypothetical protein